MINLNKNLLENLSQDPNGIYSYDFNNAEQDHEITIREKVAKDHYPDYLQPIARSHSIPVMDFEVTRFLKTLPNNANVLDIGGGWGWHWRHIQTQRPDVKIYILDFIKNNLFHAKNVLGEAMGKNAFLIHGDATQLIFENNVFDAYWSVQTLQHIPNFKKAVEEAYRVLKPGGTFINYSLNNQAVIKFIYRISGRKYHFQGVMKDGILLNRASKKQAQVIEKVFKEKVFSRHSEILFKPELKFYAAGKEHSLLGKIDSQLSNNMGFFSSIARQCAFYTIKS